MIIDGHTPGIIVPQSKHFEYNLGLIANVLQNKQQQFDTAYMGLQKLRRDSLNIKFINEKEQGKIDAFNQRINDFFNNANDLGDLSSSNITSRYTAMFNEIGNDTELINRYRQDAKYREELMKVEAKKNSDNPKKAGYDFINYSNYLYHLQSYASADLDKENVSVSPYVNYTDLNKGIQDVIKTIPIEKFTRSVPMGNGYIEERTYSGRDPNKVSAALKQYLQTDGSAQMREQAEYYFRNGVTSPGDYQRLYSRNQSNINSSLQVLDTSIERLKADMVGATGEELAGMVAQVQDLERSRTNLDQQRMSFNDFMELSDDEYINTMYGMEMTDSVSMLTNTYGGYAESVTYQPDRAFLSLQNYQLNLAKFQTDTKFKEANFNLKTQEFALKAAEAAGKVPNSPDEPYSFEYLMSADPTRLEPANTYATLQSLVENMSAYTTNPFQTSVEGEIQTDPKYNKVINEIWEFGRITDGASQNPYVQGYAKLMLEAKRMGKDKEAAKRYAHSKLEQIIQSPTDAKEVAIYNQLQDLRANQLSITNIMDNAVASGDPTQYIANSDVSMAFQYRRMVLDDAAWSDNKDTSKQAELMRNQFSSELTDRIDLRSPNKSMDDDGLNYISSIDPTLIKEVEIRPNGDAEVVFHEDAFIGARGEEGDNNYKPPGSLHNGYYSYIDKDGITQHRQFENNRMQVNLPSRNILDAHTQLGLQIGLEPQTRYVITSSGPRPFMVVRDSDGSFLFKIPGHTEQHPQADKDGWVPGGTNAQQIIDDTRAYMQTNM